MYNSIAELKMIYYLKSLTNLFKYVLEKPHYGK